MQWFRVVHRSRDPGLLEPILKALAVFGRSGYNRILRPHGLEALGYAAALTFLKPPSNRS